MVRKNSETIENKYILGMDVGASSCRSIIFDENLNVKGKAQKDFSRSHPNPGWVEIDPNEWWETLTITIRKAIEESNVPSEEIACAGLAAETDGIMPVSENGEPLRPYIHWSDSRCLPQHEWIQNNADVDEIYRITGIPLHKGWWSPPALKMLWIKENEPEIFDKTHKFLQIGNYMLYKLTGKFMTDYSSASRTLLLDIRKLEYSNFLADLLGVPVSKQPDVCDSIKLIGGVTQEAADKAGLSFDTDMATGGGDTESSALSAGVISEGQALISIGTSLMVAVPRKEPSYSIKGPGRQLFGTGLVCTSHVIPDLWILEVGCWGGGMLRWFKEEFGQIETQISNNLGISPYQILSEEAKEAKPNPNSPIFLLPIGAIIDLSIEHKRKDVIRCILEGVAYEAREVIEAAEESGIDIKTLTMVGGGTKSELWRQIITDVTNKPSKSPFITETAALGAAIIAGVGKGLYEDFQNTPEISNYVNNTPNKDIHQIYTGLYRRYKEIYHSLKD
jgi:xylulokinase